MPTILQFFYSGYFISTGLFDVHYRPYDFIAIHLSISCCLFHYLSSFLGSAGSSLKKRGIIRYESCFKSKASELSLVALSAANFCRIQLSRHLFSSTNLQELCSFYHFFTLLAHADFFSSALL